MVGACVVYVCYGVYVTVVFMPLARALDDPVLREQIQQESKAFYPVPFTTRAVDLPPYKGTDPEWQGYIRISKDKALQEKIRSEFPELGSRYRPVGQRKSVEVLTGRLCLDEIRNVVRSAAEANAVLAKRAGSPMKVRRHWLDFEYPFRPPPKFVRLG